jgi:cytochrome c oxidase assembly factor CtaG
MSPSVTWTFEPLVALGVPIAMFVYARRWQRVRFEHGARGASHWRLASFTAGMIVILIALVSPIDELATKLFAMHMIQHVLLLDIAPILIILGFTKLILRPATRRVTRIEERAGLLAAPAFAAVLYVAAMWTWHIPALYDYATEHATVHTLEHLTFMIAGSLYWWHLLSPIRSRRRLGGMGAPAYMASTKLGVGLLGILLAFSPTVLYPYYAHQPAYWGLSPHDDQALGGMIMAVEQSVVMGIALAIIFMKMLTESEREAQREERYAA